MVGLRLIFIFYFPVCSKIFKIELTLFYNNKANNSSNTKKYKEAFAVSGWGDKCGQRVGLPLTRADSRNIEYLFMGHLLCARHCADLEDTAKKFCCKWLQSMKVFGWW